MAKTIGATTAGSEFLYNADRSRILHLEFDAVDGNGVPSHYVRKRVYGLGSTLEVNYTNSVAAGSPPVWQNTLTRIYVPGPDGVVGAEEFRPSTTVQGGLVESGAYLYHYDHLGSIEAITPLGSASSTLAVTTQPNTAANAPGVYSEDAWGQRRNPLAWSGPPSTSDVGGAKSLTPRGFTGHEMLDGLGLVHMNGRIYDPLLGRMLSADLVVQFPGSLQSYDRYSYVENNPLTRFDPTGWYSVLGLEFTNGGGVTGFFKDLGSYAGASGSGAGTGAIAYTVGLAQGSAAAVVGTANAIAHPIDTAQGVASGLGNVAGRAIYDTAGLAKDIGNGVVATVSDLNKLGQAIGNTATGIAIGAGAAKAISAAGELASTAASTESVAATGTAELRVAAAAPETGAAAEVKAATTPAAEANGTARLPQDVGVNPKAPRAL